MASSIPSDLRPETYDINSIQSCQQFKRMCRKFMEKALANSITTVVADHFIALLNSRYEFFRLAQSELGSVLRVRSTQEMDAYVRDNEVLKRVNRGIRMMLPEPPITAPIAELEFMRQSISDKLDVVSFGVGGRQFATAEQGAAVDKQKELWMGNIEIVGSASSRAGSSGAGGHRTPPRQPARSPKNTPSHSSPSGQPGFNPRDRAASIRAESGASPHMQSAQRRNPPHMMAAEQLPGETEKMITMMEGLDYVRKKADRSMKEVAACHDFVAKASSTPEIKQKLAGAAENPFYGGTPYTPGPGDYIFPDDRNPAREQPPPRTGTLPGRPSTSLAGPSTSSTGMQPQPAVVPGGSRSDNRGKGKQAAEGSMSPSPGPMGRNMPRHVLEFRMPTSQLNRLAYAQMRNPPAISERQDYITLEIHQDPPRVREGESPEAYVARLRTIIQRQNDMFTLNLGDPAPNFERAANMSIDALNAKIDSVRRNFGTS
ncbi:MAG: hypothetical protein Q9187_006609 [Circinaria calcarea]